MTSNKLKTRERAKLQTRHMKEIKQSNYSSFQQGRTRHFLIFIFLHNKDKDTRDKIDTGYLPWGCPPLSCLFALCCWWGLKPCDRKYASRFALVFWSVVLMVLNCVSTHSWNVAKLSTCVFSVFWISPVWMSSSLIWLVRSVMSSRLLLEKALCAPTVGGPLELEVRYSGHLCSHSLVLALCQPEPPASRDGSGWSQPGWYPKECTGICGAFHDEPLASCNREGWPQPGWYAGIPPDICPDRTHPAW
jgi:hypothetical protein